MTFNSIYGNVCYVMNLLDSKITEIRPDYGYIDKFTLCRQIVAMNNYLLPSDDQIIETLYSIVSDGEKG